MFCNCNISIQICIYSNCLLNTYIYIQIGNYFLPTSLTGRFVATARLLQEGFNLSLFGFDCIVPLAGVQEHRRCSAAVDDSNESIRFDATSSGLASAPMPCSVPSISTAPSVGSNSTTTGRGQDGGSARNGSDDCMSLQDTTELLVIDVNFFPSYKEVTDFPARLRTFLRQRAGLERWCDPNHSSNSNNYQTSEKNETAQYIQA